MIFHKKRKQKKIELVTGRVLWAVLIQRHTLHPSPVAGVQPKQLVGRGFPLPKQATPHTRAIPVRQTRLRLLAYRSGLS